MLSFLFHISILFYLVCCWSVSVVSDSLRPHGLQHSSFPCPSVSRSLLKLMSIESVMQSNHLNFCCPLLLLPSIFSSIRVFSNELALCIRWPIPAAHEIWVCAITVTCKHSSPGGSVVKNPPVSGGATGSISGFGRPLGKEMATHSGILAWAIPRTEEPGEL